MNLSLISRSFARFFDKMAPFAAGPEKKVVEYIIEAIRPRTRELKLLTPSPAHFVNKREGWGEGS